MTYGLRCLASAVALATLSAATGPANAGERLPAAASPQSRWEGAYWGAGLSLNANGINFSGTGKRDEPDIEQGSAGVFAMLGYNHLMGSWLAGIEADIGGGGMDTRKTIAGLGTVSVDQALAGTIRARFGYTWDNALVYGTAGVALSDMEIKSSLGGKDSGLHAGLALGLGAEYAFDQNWSVRGEGLLYGFAKEDVRLAGSKRDIEESHVTFRLGAVRKF